MIELEPAIRLLDDVGEAPFTLHAHALDSDLLVGSPLTARFEWDFGDAASKRNAADGWNVAHLYDDPGVYEVTLHVTNEDGASGQITRTILVTEPSRTTFYVSPAGDDANTGLSPEVPFRTVERAVQEIDDNTTILFQRGQMFPVSSSIDIRHSNIRIGAYGSGESPALMWTGPMGYAGIIDIAGDDIGDILIEHLRFDSVYEAADRRDVVEAIYPDGFNVTIRNCRFSQITTAINANREPVGLLAQDNQADVIGAYFAWVEGSDHVYLGNKVAGSVFEHNIRLGGAQRILIAENGLSNEEKRTIWAMLGSHCYIVDNRLTDGRVTVGPNPYVGAPQERFWWSVVERNVISAPYSGMPKVELLAGADHAMVRSNVIESHGDSAISIMGFLAPMARTNDDVHVLNNTAVNMDDNGRFLFVGPLAFRVVLANNLYIAPNLVTGAHRTANVYVEDVDLRAFTAIRDNTWCVPADFSWVEGAYHYVWPYWSDAQGYLTPEQWAAHSEVAGDGYGYVDLEPDYAPAHGQPLPSEASAVTGVHTDLYGRDRPTSSAWTVGAVQLADWSGLPATDTPDWVGSGSDGLGDSIPNWMAVVGSGAGPDRARRAAAGVIDSLIAAAE